MEIDDRELPAAPPVPDTAPGGGATASWRSTWLGWPGDERSRSGGGSLGLFGATSPCSLPPAADPRRTGVPDTLCWHGIHPWQMPMVLDTSLAAAH
mmetsp:Transcript_108285/g.306197  ORF Transcript_108285/g.306197 Transcript_108285/m.306197 type:complete len:96 (-) Transcript_108285:191-478(-)